MPKDFTDNIGSIFREKEQEEHFPYNPAAWSLMEKRLDQKIANQKKRRMLFLLVIVALIIGCSALIYTTSFDKIQMTTAIDSNTQNKPVIEVTVPVLTKETSISSDKLSITGNNETESPITTALEDTKSRNNPPSEIGATIGLEVDKRPLEQAVINKNKSKLNKSVRLSSSNENQVNAPTSNTVSNTSIKLLQKEDVDATISIRSTEDILKKLPTITLTKIDNPSDRGDYGVEINQVSSDGLAFSFSLLAGIEYSILSLNSDPRRGNRLGLKMAYHLNDQWSIHGGLIYSKKLFNGSGDDFKNKDVFTDIVPVRMEGKSSFIELPIHIRYTRKVSSKSAYFIDLGMTNFNHRSEWYGFEYEQSTIEPNMTVEIPERTVNKMTFGAARLAIGYQRSISKRSSLLISPYVQAPVKGIGVGNVSIYNTGIELSYQWR